MFQAQREELGLLAPSPTMTLAPPAAVTADPSVATDADTADAGVDAPAVLEVPLSSPPVPPAAPPSASPLPGMTLRTNGPPPPASRAALLKSKTLDAKRRAAAAAGTAKGKLTSLRDDLKERAERGRRPAGAPSPQELRFAARRGDG